MIKFKGETQDFCASSLQIVCSEILKEIKMIFKHTDNLKFTKF